MDLVGSGSFCPSGSGFVFGSKIKLNDKVLTDTVSNCNVDFLRENLFHLH